MVKVASGGDAVSTKLGQVHGVHSDGAWTLDIWISTHFLRVIQRQRLTRNAALGRTLKNLKYGWSPRAARSVGGRDGIFAVTRDYEPRNQMMHKCFDRGLDSQAGVEACAAAGISSKEASAVRIVSHAMRILAFIAPHPSIKDCAAHRLLLWDVDRDTNA
jgi:hypothetical protein